MMILMKINTIEDREAGLSLEREDTGLSLEVNVIM